MRCRSLDLIACANNIRSEGEREKLNMDDSEVRYPASISYKLLSTKRQLLLDPYR